MGVRVKEEVRDGVTVLAMRRSVPPTEVPTALGEILPGVFAFAVSQGIAITGPPLCCYEEFTEASVTLVAGVSISGEPAPEGEVILYTLPAGRYAVAVHEGSYDSLDETYRAVDRYLEGKGLEARTTVYEIYLTDPDEYPDPKDWRTEVLRLIEEHPDAAE